MANRWLHAGCDIGTVRKVGSPINQTLGTARDSTYCDCAVGVSSGNSFYNDFVDSAGASDAAASGETLWYRFDYRSNSGGGLTAANMAAIVDASDQPWLALRTTGTVDQLGLYYNSGTGGSPAWTLIGSIFTFGQAATPPPSVVITVTLGSPHQAEVLVNGTSVVSGSFTAAGFGSADAVIHQQTTSTGNFSQTLASVGINLVGSHVYTGKPTGAGSNSGWTGAYTTLDEAGVDDADLISSGTAAQRSTFAYANVPTLASGYALGDLFMFTRGKNDGAAPTNIKPVRRTSGGTDNVGSSFSGMGAGFAEFLTRYSGITEAEYNASEFGAESAT